jgi:hypothetical protein
MAGVCEKIAKINADAEVQKAGYEAIRQNNPLALFNNLVDKIGGKNESTQMTTNVANTNLRTINESILQNKCENVTAVDQTNSIVQSTDCYKIIGTICGQGNTECLKEMSAAIGIKGITQKNSAKAKSDCKVDAMIQAMSKQASTIENVAALKAMQDAQGAGANNKGAQYGCNEVNTNITDEKYLKISSECINEVKTKQLNLLNSCSAIDVDQANEVDLEKKCLIGAGIISESSQGSDVKNLANISSEQTAVGLSPTASLASLGSCCCCCIIIIIIVVVFGAMGSGGKPADVFKKLQAFKS